MLTLEDYRKLEDAWAYQDFVTQSLINIGISVNVFQSVTYQMKYGESASGIEIKNDRKMSETGNIYIEFRQRSIRNSEEQDSGIYQKDQSWLYVIGDYTTIYIFAKVHLQSLLKKVMAKPSYWSQKYGIALKKHKNDDGVVTSYGMVIPTKYVDENHLAIKKLEVSNRE